MVAGKHRGLPDLPLLELTVTKQGIDAVAVTPQLSGERHAHGHRDPLAQGAGAHVNPGGIPHVGMSLELGPQVTQGLELLFGKVPPLGEGGVEARGAVALREDKAVALGLERIGRIDVHLLEVQVGEYLGRRERPAGVARLGRMGRCHDAATQLPRDLLKVGIVHAVSFPYGDF